MQLRGKAVPATAGISQVKLLDAELESSVPCCIVGVPGEAESLLLGSAQTFSLLFSTCESSEPVCVLVLRTQREGC